MCDALLPIGGGSDGGDGGVVRGDWTGAAGRQTEKEEKDVLVLLRRPVLWVYVCVRYKRWVYIYVNQKDAQAVR